MRRVRRRDDDDVDVLAREERVDGRLLRDARIRPRASGPVTRRRPRRRARPWPGAGCRPRRSGPSCRCRSARTRPSSRAPPWPLGPLSAPPALSAVATLSVRPQWRILRPECADERGAICRSVTGRLQGGSVRRRRRPTRAVSCVARSPDLHPGARSASLTVSPRDHSTGTAPSAFGRIQPPRDHDRRRLRQPAVQAFGHWLQVRRRAVDRPRIGVAIDLVQEEVDWGPRRRP